MMDEERFVRGVVARLTREHEMTEPRPCKMGDSPPEYIDQMLKAVVGIQVKILRIECIRFYWPTGRATRGQRRPPAPLRRVNTESMSSGRPA